MDHPLSWHLGRRSIPLLVRIPTGLLLLCVVLQGLISLGCQKKTPPSPPPKVSLEVVPSPGSETHSLNHPWFRKAQDTGIDFVHQSGTSEVKPFPSANGSGLAALDFDLDGWVDLFFASGAPFPLDASQSPGKDGFFRNLGERKFVDITDQVGLGFEGYSIGTAVGDYDNDGFPDLYVSCFGTNLLYHNQGDGSFQRVDSFAGINNEDFPTGAMFFDADNDGNLDLYVCNYGLWNFAENPYCAEKGIQLYCSPKIIKPSKDAYFHNRGDGTFENATDKSGLGDRSGRAQGVVAADVNEDGFLDIYVGNDLNANSFFVNDGTGKFRDETELSGVGYDSRGNSQAGMGVDAADYNRDGLIDLFVTNFKDEYSSLYQARDSGIYFEVSAGAGLTLDTLPYVSWGTGFADFNLDGWVDLFAVNGHVDNNRHLKGEDAPFANPDQVWQNDQGRFRFLSASAGDYFAETHSSRGMALLDLDNDGDEDVVVGHQDESPSLLENLTISPRSPLAQGGWIHIRWIGQSSNRSAIGLQFRHQLEELPYFDQLTAGGSYLSASEFRSTFAVPEGVEEVSLDVTFPGGPPHRIQGLRPNCRYTVVEGRTPDAAPTVTLDSHDSSEIFESP
jgi:hypothetical protein